MRTNPAPGLPRPLPLPLPATSIPDGCRPWTLDLTSRWTQALPPRWVPVRWRALYVSGAVAVAVLAAGALTLYAGLWPWVAALVAGHVVWVVVRPEAVPFSAPVAVALILVTPGARWEVALPVVAGLAFGWVAACLRLAARRRQREAAVAAAGGLAAALPDRETPLKRGAFLAGLGLVLGAGGAVLLATADHWTVAGDRGAELSFGWLMVLLALSVLASAALARRRAAALRGAAPVPVLRVLVRENGDGDTEIFAADDVTARRPLFTVALMRVGREPDDETDEEELEKLFDRMAADEPGPLREAVLYGTPYDGAETVLVSAAEGTDEPPVVERSAGPVRPLPEAGVRRLAVDRERTRAHGRREQELRDSVAGAMTAVPVRRWRAGGVDWLASVFMAQWGLWVCWGWFAEADGGFWDPVLIEVLGVFGAYRLVVKSCWRLTADRTGLWLNGLRGPRHIPWDDFRTARRKSFQLKLRWRDDSWAVSAPYWGRVQRILGRPHPYDALAAELTAMHSDPLLRPTGESEARERGRPLCPLTAALAVAWTTAVIWVWAGAAR
ncbi:hypothetical protein SSP24_71130 [Streptomyces spinoverrucosus]|uniref:Uncharacterized protein n=1 Tax=Streptomyces spinoverrucosus TaxID=284043 RepID=A0A4Y3VT83_9ACTN|nr:hypothetical protein [Streptomyces spinoverrucosus]GEC09458.1 hypothetical protein SSP24_71130 [Streptomyces spinoverrucosus]GHB86501.1 hypothetical protein GCM10010397_67720 [Streptomyces spinoverrucosus]